MKKYNLSKIMKRAWEIRRKTTARFSYALKQAWGEAKMEVKVYPAYSLDGKIGTAEEKKQAEELVKSFCQTFKESSLPDTIEESDKFIYHSHDKWESSYIDLAYRFIKAAISIRKTYGEVISLLRYNNASIVTRMLVQTANQKGMTPADYVDSVLAMVKMA